MKTQMAVDDFLRSRQARNLSPITIAWYREKLQLFARLCPELPEEPGPIEEHLATIQGVPETRHAHFRALRAFFKFVSERYEPASRKKRLPNPMTKVAPPRCPKKVMTTLEPDETMRLLLSSSSSLLLSSSSSSLRDKALLTLLIDTGIRTSEAAGLRKQDIKTSTVRVRGKTGEREIPISEETKGLLLTLSAQDKGEYIFNGHKGPLGRHGVYRIVNAHMKKAGISGPKLGGHRLRHAFGKGYLVNGGDLRSLQQIMGHANITTTEKYAALTLDDTIKKHHQFTPLRAAHAAAQESFLDKVEAVREAEEILERKTR
ncbi:Tyrosine recombinase XerC [subsurface metagenome]